MEPIEGTRRTLHALEIEGMRVEADLRMMAREAQRIVPEIVGLTLADLKGGLTFTMVATDVEIAALDAIQYLDGGPCVEGAHEGDPVEVTSDGLISEDQWMMFAHATAAHGVASTLTLPLLQDRDVVGSVNLYASTPEAFEGNHDELANALGASAVGAVTNADLSFSTRLVSERAPATLEDQDAIAIAVGIIAAHHRVDISTATERLRLAAARAGVSEAQAAKAVRHSLDFADE
jgi:transcriptional regulator with GAF, ATPase, and Fis domain